MSRQFIGSEKKKDDDSTTKSANYWPQEVATRDNSLAATSSYEWNDPFHPIPIQNVTQLSQGEHASDEAFSSSEVWMNNMLHPLLSSDISRNNTDDSAQLANRNTSVMTSMESATSYSNPYGSPMDERDRFLPDRRSCVEHQESISRNPRVRKRSRSSDYQEANSMQEWNRMLNSVYLPPIQGQMYSSHSDHQANVDSRSPRSRQKTSVDHYSGDLHHDVARVLDPLPASNRIHQPLHFSPHRLDTFNDNATYQLPGYSPSAGGQQSQTIPPEVSSSRPPPRPKWIWHKPSERIELPPTQPIVMRDGSGERRYNMMFATITMPYEMARSFDTETLFSMTKNALESAAFTNPNITTTVPNCMDNSHRRRRSSGEPSLPADNKKREGKR
jgi:hypothetical protein